MAGYIINLDSIPSLRMYIYNGIYATKMSPPKDSWARYHEGTFADYATMKQGDNVYFFIKRKIYGVGKLAVVGDDCKYLNYPDANKPQNYRYESIKPFLLWDEGPESTNQRWICLFEPDPFFFKNGIDMDEALSSNPAHFRMLRVLWKLSFIKVDDEENQSLIDIILRRNQEALDNPYEKVFPSSFAEYHNNLLTKLDFNYRFTASDILKSCANGLLLSHEMAIEAALLHQLSIKEPTTIEVFGEWDYLSHQVVASPFKPVDYMDKMDVFGYAYIKGYNQTKSRFLVVEIKKGTATDEDVDQLMKYVDFVKDEYSFGEYSMINAFLVAYDFPQGVITHARRVGERKYVIGQKPARSETWSNMKLINYRYNPDSNLVEFFQQG